jgi:malate permease and related proteins
MEIFISLVVKLIPLYIIIGLWLLASKKLHAQKETIAKFLIYIISPVVIFYWTYTATLDRQVFLLPLLFFVVASWISILFLGIGKIAFGDNKIKNILAFTAWTGNTGYFGLPVILALFDENAFSIAVLSILGFVLYENTVGFYITAKGNYSSKESLLKVLKLPTIYAFLFGLILNTSHIEIGEIATQTILNFKWAYIVLWMLIIGMGLSNINRSSFHINFLSLCFAAKFIVWPTIMLWVIFLDTNLFWLFTQDIYNIMILMSIVPLAANTIALATEFETYPEEVSLTVFLSTLFALLYIPFMVNYLIS